MAEHGVSLATIRAARERIAPHIHTTPLWPSNLLSELTGVAVLMKCEQLQRAGSFKIRGAANFVGQLAAADRARGLVAASAGNHAQGVALAGAAAGIAVTVVMPSAAPLAKAAAARGYGARVVLHGASLEEARAEALAIAGREGRLFVPRSTTMPSSPGRARSASSCSNRTRRSRRSSSRPGAADCWRGSPSR